MNLPLHYGVLGAVEAGLIAFIVGVLCFLFWHWLCDRQRWSIGHAVGWACVMAVLVGAGIDAWHLFYLGISRLESPLYARLALQGIHDAESLGSRVVLEIAGALGGVALGWQWFSKKTSDETSPRSAEKTDA